MKYKLLLPILILFSLVLLIGSVNINIVSAKFNYTQPFENFNISPIAFPGASPSQVTALAISGC